MSFSQREARSIIRKAVSRVPEGEEIRHINITPMVDMMTILLVVAIFQASTSSTDLVTTDLSLPESKSHEPQPDDASTLMITKQGIMVVVNGKAATVAAVRNGDVDAKDKEGGALGNKIPKLTSYLANLRGEEMRARQATGKPPTQPELLILADKTTPYRLLISVLYSAKHEEAGYKRFRLVVQRQYASGGEAPAK